MQESHFSSGLYGDASPGFCKQTKIVDEINVVLRVGCVLRRVGSIKDMGGRRQIGGREERIAIFIVVNHHPMVAVCWIADSEESISTGGGSNSGFAVERKSVLYFADEPEIAGQPDV